MTRFECTAARPMPEGDHTGEIWVHVDVEEIDETDDGRLVRYWCQSCGLKFWLDLGD